MGVQEFGMTESYSISLYPGSGTVDGKHGDHILIAPAYNATKEDLELIVTTTARVIKEYFVQNLADSICR